MNKPRIMRAGITACLLFIFSLAVSAQTWLWYPGQLAAYRQAKQKAMSEARCVNVNYPGKFNPKSHVAYFKNRKDGKVLKVERSTNLPALWGNRDDWQVSLDGKHWNIPESDNRNCDRNILPDADKEIVVPVKPRTVKVLNNAKVSGDDIKMGRGGAVLVDFHELELGDVTMTVNGQGRIGFWVGESEEEAMNEDALLSEQAALPTYTLKGQPLTITLPDYAVRYLKIRTTDNVMVSNLVFNAKMWPVEQELTFKCSSDRINDLFNAGIKTLHTSLHNFYLDGVKRDFLPWAMDAMVSSLGADYAFGDRQVTRNCISIALMAPHPTEADWGVVDYPLHAIIGLEEEYQRYGDIETSLMYRDRIEQQLQFFEDYLDKRGFLEAKRPTWGFIPGWNLKNGPDQYGVATYAQMLLYLNFKIAAKFERRWGDMASARHYEALATKLAGNIKRTFWDGKRKAFVNGLREDGSIDKRISHQAQIMAVIAGLYPKRYDDKLFDDILPNLPYYYTDVSYEKGYDALAYTMAGRVKELYTLLNKVWGRWLDEGGVRYPENFYIDAPRKDQLSFYGRPFGMSLCHGANGVPPVLFVLRGIMGFDVQEGVYVIKPNLLDLTWAKGRIPTAKGYIELSLSKDGQSTITIPGGCGVKVIVGGETLFFSKPGTYVVPLK
jgi:hypothetical protein